MPTRHLHFWVSGWCLMFLLLAGAGCTTSRTKTTAPKVASQEAPESEAEMESRIRAMAAYSTGVLLQERDEPEAAYEQFARAAENDPSNEALATVVAQYYLQKNLPDQALVVLKRTSSQPGASGVIQSLWADTLWHAGQTNAAIKAYESAIRTTPTLLAAYQQLAAIQLERQQPAQALAVVEKSLATSSDDPVYWLNAGDLFAWFTKNVPSQKVQALADYKKALDRADALQPKDPTLLLRLGRGYLDVGENGKAESLFAQASAQLPKSPAVAAGLAEAMIKDGRLKEARAHLELLSRSNPTSHFPWYFLGVIELEERHDSDAQRMFERAIQLNPDFEPAYADLAVSFLNQNDSEKAIAVLKRGLDKFPTSFRLVYLTGLAEARRKDYGRALENFQKAEALAKASSPELLDHRYYFQVGAMLEQAGKEKESMEYLERSLALKPDYDEALNHLGYMWADKGVNLEQALDYIQRAVEAEPDNPAYLDSLGWVLFKLGRIADALPPLERAVKLLPEPDATVYDHLGDVLAALGRKAEAKQAWTKSLSLEKSPAVEKKLRETP